MHIRDISKVGKGRERETKKRKEKRERKEEKTSLNIERASEEEEGGGGGGEYMFSLNGLHLRFTAEKSNEEYAICHLFSLDGKLSSLALEFVTALRVRLFMMEAASVMQYWMGRLLWRAASFMPCAHVVYALMSSTNSSKRR
jgi:hypothetical protein